MSYTTAQAERAVYKAYLETLDEPEEHSLEHLKNCIRESMRVDLTEKQREYLELHMLGHTSREIAKMCNVNKSTVSRVINNALDNLFEHIRYATPRTLDVSERVRKYLTSPANRR